MKFALPPRTAPGVGEVSIILDVYEEPTDDPDNPCMVVAIHELEGRISLPPKAWLRTVRAELKIGDVIVAVGGKRVSTLMEFYRRLWALGAAGVQVPLTIYREGDTLEVTVTSSTRAMGGGRRRIAVTTASTASAAPSNSQCTEPASL